ncbi:MAG TPA: O-antigen ligase family protein [Phototrophicaceae bacterium]|nr:O-antigen ligase family protein [Phototrophicaceae bacterium]
MRISLLPLSLCILLFAVSALFGTLPAYDRSLTQEVLTAILGSTLLYLLAAYGIRSAGAARLVAALLVLFGVVFVLFFIGQFGYWNYVETPAFIQRLGRATTFLPVPYWIFIHPNGAATLLEGLLPLGLALLLSSRKRMERVLWAGTVVVMAYGIFLTFSRGAWLSLALAAGLIGVLVALSRLPRRVTVGLLAGGVSLVALAIVTGLMLGPERLPFLNSIGSVADSRLTLYRNALHLAGDYAFTGLGLGQSFTMVYSRYSLLIFVPFLLYAHSLPLAVWLGQGLLGLMALLGMIVMFYRLVYRTLRWTQPGALFHGAWLGVTATLIHGLTDARQYIESPWAMPVWFLLFGLAAALARSSFREAALVQVAPGPRRWRLAVGAAAALIVLVLIFNAPLRALWLTNQGAVAETRALLAPDLPQSERDSLNEIALQNYRAALALAPDLPNANRRLGNLYVELKQYAEAVPFLETAAAVEPAYPAAVKGLGLAYVWVGKTDEATQTLARLENRRDLINELNTWSNFWGGAGQPELAAAAQETANLLARQ